MKKKGEIDLWLLVTVIVLVACGTFMVYSASSVSGVVSHNDSLHFVKQQLLGVGLGFVGLIFFANFNYDKIGKFTKISLILVVVGLVALFIPGVGVSAKGATRWISFLGQTIQPSEFAKIVLVAFLAFYLEKKQKEITNFWSGVVPSVLLIGMIVGLIALQPDLSTALVVAVTALAMLLCAGVRWAHMLSLSALGLVGGIGLLFSKDYRMERIFSFLSGSTDIQDTAYQLNQSLLALGAGGMFGVGLGISRQKWFYIPEPHTDFIFSILGEEFGFVGTTFTILLFALFIYRGYLIAMKADSMAGMLLAVGITTMIGFQAMLNIGVVSGLLPNTGIPLPFISFGSNSMLVCLVGAGILLGISRGKKKTQ